MIDYAGSTDTAQPNLPNEPASGKRRWLARIVSAIAVIAALAGGIGIGVAISPSEEENQAKIDVAVADQRAALAAEQAEAKQALADAEGLAEQAAADQTAADDARKAADTHADEVNAELDARSVELDKREAALAPREEYAAKSTFGSGLHMVGQDINPGTYRTNGGKYCYWERLSGTSGEFEDIITNDLPSGASVVTISSSDVAFKSNDCGTWTMTG